MTDDSHDWEARVALAWERSTTLVHNPSNLSDLVAEIDALADELPADDPRALFERAAVRDTAGLETEAEPLYRGALAPGTLDPLRRARAVIQLASTLRLLGRLAESEQLLNDELARRASRHESEPLHDETLAFLALTYLAQGRAAEAAALALTTLAPHLARYDRAVAGNAAELVRRAVLSRPCDVPPRDHPKV